MIIMKVVFLGIGTNLGDRGSNLKKAVDCIEENIGEIMKSSSVYLTEPWGFQSEDEFLNIVVKVNTKLTPSCLMKRILKIESLSGRIRNKSQYSSRVIDIDILFYEDMIIDEEILKIPHPLIQERKFVLVPLCEIAPNMVHPVFKKSIHNLLEESSDKRRINKLS
jgi:2-amino-4-hydroxy-6-hydroxymethyldihydropteridine diphosphokinase